MCFYVVLENLNGKVCKNHEKTDKTQLKIQHVLQYHGIGEMLGKQNVCIFYGEIVFALLNAQSLGSRMYAFFSR